MHTNLYIHAFSENKNSCFKEISPVIEALHMIFVLHFRFVQILKYKIIICRASKMVDGQNLFINCLGPKSKYIWRPAIRRSLHVCETIAFILETHFTCQNQQSLLQIVNPIHDPFNQEHDKALELDNRIQKNRTIYPPPRILRFLL